MRASGVSDIVSGPRRAAFQFGGEFFILYAKRRAELQVPVYIVKPASGFPPFDFGVPCTLQFTDDSKTPLQTVIGSLIIGDSKQRGEIISAPKGSFIAAHFLHGTVRTHGLSPGHILVRKVSDKAP